MIAVDTSSFIAFLAGEEGEDVSLIIQAIEGEVLVLPPVVIAELLSARNLSIQTKHTILALPQLETTLGYWQRVGNLRRTILTKKKKANLADSMIAVSCIDYDAPLITRDRDYRHFVVDGGLRLMG